MFSLFFRQIVFDWSINKQCNNFFFIRDICFIWISTIWNDYYFFWTTKNKFFCDFYPTIRFVTSVNISCMLKNCSSNRSFITPCPMIGVFANHFQWISEMINQNAFSFFFVSSSKSFCGTIFTVPPFTRD